MEHLHYRGLLRIAQRENGIRVYECAPAPIEPLPSEERLRRLILTLAGILAPIPSRTLHTNIARYRDLGNPRAAVRDFINKGELQSETVDGLEYISPSRQKLPEEAPRIVRLLAPFDPMVWDRRRFEHLWGWPYRFEAYTPPAKRVRGYYAMPLLWCDNIIGWANARVVGSRLKVEVGFVKKPPRDAEFRRELEAEKSRLGVFLGL